jgi:hypothetical protein
LILVAAGMLVPAFLLPLWELRIQTKEFPDGLRLDIYASKFEAGKTEFRDDLLEINALNHFIGMRPLEGEEFVEFKWMPFVLGVIILLALRVIVFGTMAKLIDLFVFYAYFGIFALWSFYEKLYAYGHTLNPYATLKVAPFTPPLFGHEKVANFDLYGSPAYGAVFLVVVPVFLFGAILLSRATWRKDHLPSRDYLEA